MKKIKIVVLGLLFLSFTAFVLAAEASSIEIKKPSFKKNPELDKIITQILDSIVQKFKDECVGEGDLGGYGSNYSLYIDHDEVAFGNGYISFIFSVYRYMGGPHGMTDFIPIYYSVKEKKLLNLKEAVKPVSKNWLKNLSIEARRQLTAQVKKGELSTDEQSINAGTEAVVDNFSIFKIENGNVKIIFNQYQVAPYAAGIPEIIIPISFFKK